MKPRKAHKNGITGPRTGYDWFGYRPGQDFRRPLDHFPYSQGKTDRQKFLDAVLYDQKKRKWKERRRELGREGWEDLGNKDLPIEKHRDEIMKMIASNRVSLLAGETGSGKSTQLAQYALEMGYDHIVYLQPRRVITDGISERLDEELTEQFTKRGIDKPEHLVGMAHSERATLTDDSTIQVMTSAVFTRRASKLKEEWVDKNVLIVADEVHEGNIETEFAVATAAELMTEQESWNMVLMSATLDSEKIQDAYTPINGRQIPQVTVEGRPHEIEPVEESELDVIGAFEKHCLSGSKTLIFTDGKRSVGMIRVELELRYGRGSPPLRILKLHSKISESARKEIFSSEDDPNVHTVIVSTSAGQSGLTIPSVDRVISDGWTKSPELDGENAAGLPRRLCSKAELTQQMGRGGRDIDGAKFILTNPFEDYENLVRPHLSEFRPLMSDERPDHAEADIYHSIITKNVLTASAMGKDFYTLNEFLINKVTAKTIEEAYTVLKLLGAVDSSNQITDIGREMNKYPLRPELSRAVVEASLNGTVAQQCQIAAIASAIEAGGIGAKLPQAAKSLAKLLSTETNDDFLAELDYFMSTTKYKKTHTVGLDELRLETCWSGFIGLESQDDDQESYTYTTFENLPNHFDVQNVVRAHKQYRKICRAIGIEEEAAQNELTNTLPGAERQAIHDMLLTGMPHLLYEEVKREANRGRQVKDPITGKKKKRPPIIYYRNILGPESHIPYEYDRKISKLSLLGAKVVAHTGLVAGYPRWRIDEEGITHNEIVRGFPTTKDAVRRALGISVAGLTQQTVVGPDGGLRMVSSWHIGRLQVGSSKSKDRATTPNKAELLTASALERPGPAQRELRQLKRYLDGLAERVPEGQMAHYFNCPLLNDASLKIIVAQASYGAASLGELDSNIRRGIADNNIRLEKYISPERLQAIEENMPSEIVIGGDYYKLHYTGRAATPMIYEFPLYNASSLPSDKLTIGDGREVLFRYHYSEDEVRYLTVADVRDMARIKK